MHSFDSRDYEHNCEKIYFKGELFENNEISCFCHSIYFKNACSNNKIIGKALSVYLGERCANNNINSISRDMYIKGANSWGSEEIYLGDYCSGNNLLNCQYVIFGPSKSAILNNCCNNSLDMVWYSALTPEAGESFNNLVFHKGINLYESDESWAHVLLVPEGSNTYETNIYASNSQTVML